jgi:ABC-2 type transport system ATP-binding protein
MVDTAERLCDRVGIIHNGRNVASGSLEKLRRIAEMGEDSTLEQLFLKLTQEAEEVVEEKPMKRRLFGLFRKKE